MGTSKKEFWAYAGMSLMTAIIGLSFIFMKVALRFTGPVDLLAHRFNAAFVAVLLLQAAGVLKFPRFNFKKSRSLLLLTLFYPVLFFLLQTFGVQFSTASEAGIVFAITPVLTMLSAAIFLKEKTGFLQKTGILLSVAGVLYIIFKTGNHAGTTDLKGILLLLLSVLAIVAYYTAGKKIGPTFSPTELTVLMTYLAFIVFNAWAITIHIQHNTLSHFFEPLKQAGFLIPVLYLGVLSSLLTSFLSNYALTAIPASKIAVFNNLSPVITIAGGILFLDERLYGYHLTGGVLVLAGIAATLFFKNRPGIPGKQ